MNTSATSSGRSSCMTWPTLSQTTILNLPYMCAIVSSLSILSFPAKRSCFGIRKLRKQAVRPVNHSVQYYLLASKSVLQTYTYWPVLGSSRAMTWAGIETLADLRSRTWLLVRPYFTTLCRFENYVGRDFTIDSINGKASKAEPSTTSMINIPLMCLAHSSPAWLASM